MTNFAAFDRVVAAWQDDLGVPGIAVTVVHDGQTHVMCRGTTRLTDGVPIDERTLFQIASATKPMTATAVMRLVEAGQCDLDELIRSYIPELRLKSPAALQQITVRHLLTHTAGFEGDIDCPEDWGDDALESSLSLFADLPQNHNPGQAASYSNAGLRLLGLMVQRLSGMSFEEYVTTTVLRPIGMSSSYFLPWDFTDRVVATGHGLGEGGLEPRDAYELWRAEMPEGGVVCTIGDMATWAHYQLTGAHSEVSPLRDETRRLMQELAVPASPPLVGIAMPWHITERSGIRVVSHGGNHGNVSVSTFDMIPSHGLAVSVLANARAGKDIGARALTWLLQEHLGVAPPAPAPIIPMDCERLSEYAGRYDLGLGTFRVAVDGPGLIVTIETTEEVAATHADFPPVEVVPVGDDLFALAEDRSRPTCLFMRSSSGDITFLQMMGRAAPRRNVTA